MDLFLQIRLKQTEQTKVHQTVLFRLHSPNITIGRSKGGGTASTHPSPPQRDPIFVFAYVFAEKCPHQRSAPPPPQREILDPQLITV